MTIVDAIKLCSPIEAKSIHLTLQSKSYFCELRIKMKETLSREALSVFIQQELVRQEAVQKDITLETIERWAISYDSEAARFVYENLSAWVEDEDYVDCGWAEDIQSTDWIDYTNLTAIVDAIKFTQQLPCPLLAIALLRQNQACAKKAQHVFSTDYCGSFSWDWKKETDNPDVFPLGCHSGLIKEKYASKEYYFIFTLDQCHVLRKQPRHFSSFTLKKMDSLRQMMRPRLKLDLLFAEGLKKSIAVGNSTDVQEALSQHAIDCQPLRAACIYYDHHPLPCRPTRQALCQVIQFIQQSACPALAFSLLARYQGSLKQAKHALQQYQGSFDCSAIEHYQLYSQGYCYPDDTDEKKLSFSVFLQQQAARVETPAYFVIYTINKCHVFKKALYGHDLPIEAVRENCVTQPGEVF